MPYARVRIGLVTAAVVLAACGGDDGSGAGPAAGTSAPSVAGTGGSAAAGAGSAGGAGDNVGGGAGAGPSPEAGADASGIPAAVDAGAPPCPELAVRCNDECVSAESPAAGNCAFYARVDAVMDMALASNGDLYTGSYSSGPGTGGTLRRIAAGGGAPVTLGDEPYNIEHLLVDGDTLYFLTHQEQSTVHMRLTGSIGRVELPDGVPEVLVSDVPDGPFEKTATSLYVGADQIDPGLRQFDLNGGGELLLTDHEIMDFRIVGDVAYLLDDSFRLGPVMQLPLAGGDVTELGGGQCQQVLGADATSLYALCVDLKRIALTDGTAETLVQAALDTPVMSGGYVYYVNKVNPPRGPYALNRASTLDGKVERLATIDDEGALLYLMRPVVGADAVYLSVNSGYSVPPRPGFVLRIALPQ